MPWRVPGSKNLMIDRRFRGVGRIARSSGTSHLKTYRQINAMLTHLYKTGRLTILKEIKDGLISPMEAYSAHLEDRLETLPSALTLKPLFPNLKEWLEKYDVAESTKRRYRELVNRLDKHSPDDSTLESLPAILAQYKDQCKDGNTAVTFNRTRTVVQAYLRDTIGNDSPLWVAVSKIDPLKAKPKIPKNPLTVGQLVGVLNELKKENPQYAVITKWLALTGMNYAEYASEDWEVGIDRVTIHGTKREARERVVPLIDGSDVPTTFPQYNTYRMALKRLKHYSITPHDLRRTFAHLTEMAQIPRSRRKMYLGHISGDVTDTYERHTLDNYLKEDAEAIREYIKNWFDESFERVTEDMDSEKLAVLRI